MSQMGGGQPRRSGPPDIYTVLVMVAAVALLIAVVFVATKNMALTGSGNPFAVLGLVTSPPIAAPALV